MLATTANPWMHASDLAPHIAECTAEDLHTLRIKGALPKDLWRRRDGSIYFHRDTIAWIKDLMADPALWWSAEQLATVVYRGTPELIHQLREQGKLPPHWWRRAEERFEYHRYLVAWPALKTMH